MTWVLIALMLIMEAGWLTIGAASPRLTESGPFTDAMLGAFQPIWAWADPLRRSQTPESTARLVFLAGLIVTCAAYATAVIALMYARVKRLYVWIAAGVGVYGVTLLLTPGLLSTDAVAYVIYGRIAAVHSLNPYLVTPASVGGDSLIDWAGGAQDFVNHASPYGPLWTLLSSALVAADPHATLLAEVQPYRIIGLVSHGVNAYLVWRLASRLAPDGAPGLAALAYAWNPLTLFELVGSGHNDGFMLGLVLTGLLLALSTRAQLVGAALVWSGALVKWVPATTLLYLVCATTQAVQGWGARARHLAARAVVLGLLTLVLFGAWLDPRDVAALLASPAVGSQRYVNALLDLPTPWLASHVVDRAGADVAASQLVVREWTFSVARLLVLVYVIAEATRLWRRAGNLGAVLEASARTLLVVLLLAANQVLAWYFTWPLALAAPLGMRNRLAQLAVAYSVLDLPLFYAIHENMLPTTVVAPLIVSFVALPLLCVLFVGRARPTLQRASAPGQVAA